VAALSLFIGKASKMSGALFDSFSCLSWYAKLAIHISVTFQCLILPIDGRFLFLFYPQSSRRAAYFLLEKKKLFDLGG
jgi:hypothetical protein